MSGAKDKHLLCLIVLSRVGSSRPLETVRGSVVGATLVPLMSSMGMRMRRTIIDYYLVDTENSV